MPKLKKKIIKHLKDDIKDFRHEAKEDKELIKELKNKKGKMAKHKGKKLPKSKGKAKIEKVMHEYKEGKLHSGSKKGPEVKNPKQAIAIALSEARKSGAKIKKKKK